jgi:hypothetical protein
MPTHTIKITTHGREYQTSGAVSIRAASNPVRAAAAALLKAGHDPADTLKAVADGVSLSPVTLASLARQYVPPRAAWGPDRDAERAAASRA